MFRVLGGIHVASIDAITSNNLAGITHVLSIVPGPLPDLSNYVHKQIEITDEETTNLLEHLPETNRFIDEALFDGTSNKHKGAVVVHCVQGESRSVAVVVAYLMYKYHLTYKQALHAVKRKNPRAQPNDGFVEQLQLYEKMECQVLLTNEFYKQFLIDQSLRQDPLGASLKDLHFFRFMDQYEEDELLEDLDWELDDDTALAADPHALSEIRCKRCRFVLAYKKHMEHHDPPDAESRQAYFTKTAGTSRRIVLRQLAAATCSHYFMAEPVKWMRAELVHGNIDGKFACPKCESKVGGYSWKGSRCSCGKWMIPAIHLQAAKADFVKREHQHN